MTSASTLARKAAKSKNPAVAKRLRSQAARLRREARAKSKKVVRTRRVEPYTSMRETFEARARSAETAKALNDAIYGDGRTELSRSPVSDPATDGEARWQVVPSIIQGYEVDRLRTLARIKRKADDETTDPFEIGLRAKLVDAKVAGKKEAEQANTALLKQVHEVNRINVVSAFIAELEGVAAANGGTIPKTLVVSGYTLARVLDALRDAGHTTEGKEGIRKRT
jgi:hypothetical protein